MSPWSDIGVWDTVADELRGYRRDGLSALLTEDVVRFATARALVRGGVRPSDLRVEVKHPALTSARVDLVVGESPSAVIELKFPREPNALNAAWTMCLGEIVNDLYRLAAYPGDVDRLFVLAETRYLRRYLTETAPKYGLHMHAEDVELHPAQLEQMPASARELVNPKLAVHSMTAHRIAIFTIDNSLSLTIYRVDPAPVDSVPKPELPAVAAAIRTGVRREILDAIGAVLVRSGAEYFTPAEIVAEMTRRGTDYAESTIRTMITAHLCRNAPDNAAVTYDDLERVDRGRYRLAN